MRCLRCLPLVLLVTSSSLAQSVPVEEFRLENGLRFLFVPKKGESSVYAGWIAKVGSVNERPGITGTAHLFEHMMFKGTTTIGTRDPEKDAKIIAKLDAVKAGIAEEFAKLEEKHRLGEIEDPLDPKNRSERHEKLRREFEELLDEQKQVIVKDEFDKIYSGAGASGMNAGTSYDFTVYFITLPKNKLELWYWMESNRLFDPVFREFYSERDVVREERRLRTESTPTGIFEEQFESFFWNASPYSWPVIGWPLDVEAITRDEALAFYDTYYAPSNLTACIVGDYSIDEAKALATKYFGRLPKAKAPPPPFRTREVKQVAEKRMIAEAPAEPQVRIRYHTVASGHRDEFALDVLASILNGPTGRLKKELVLDQKLATQAFARQDGRKYDGYFEIRGIAKKPASPEDVEKSIHALLAKMAEEPVTDRELQKVKNQSSAAEFRKLRSGFNLLLELLVRDSIRDWRSINEDPAKVQAVTPADLQRVIEKYFLETNRSVLTIHTREDEGKEAPAEPPVDLASLTPEQLQALEKAKADLAQRPKEFIEQSLTQLRQVLPQVPPKQQPFYRALTQVLTERLAELEGAESKSPAPEGAGKGGAQ